MKTIGIVTTGGDAPGMNATIRGVTRIAYSNNIKVLGFERGWEGIVTNTFQKLTPRSVGGIINTGGTMLHTIRLPEFKTDEYQKKAADNLALNNIDGLIVIGGNGSMHGALELSKKTSTAMVGIPASIDNDIYGTEETIGFDTAVNTAVEVIDKIRDTAISHERIFVVEVMGRERGFLAAYVGICVGAEVILVPEQDCPFVKTLEIIKDNAKKGKKAGIIVSAEGVGDNAQLAKDLQKQTKSEVRLSIVGYAQRGGSPTARSRLLASLFAQKAVDL
ncbi:MAG: ATP-dependent 6-phosphofructokinase, partial [Crenarchaeota archaeon]|nr:ATP-dependent 6-phosphofructokinase [Thermoproteota archaeon]